MPSTIDGLLSTVGRVIAAVPQFLATNGGAASFLGALGFSLPPGAADIGLSVLDVSNLANALAALDDALAAGTSGLALDAKYAAVALEVDKAFTAIRAALAQLSATPDYLSKTQIEHELLPRLSSSVLAALLAARSPFAAQLAQFAGVITTEMYPADPSIYQVQHVRPTVHWDALGKLFSDPAGQIAARYGWGTPQFDGNALLTNLSALLEIIGLPARVRQLPRRLEEQLAGVLVPDADANPAQQLVTSLVRSHDSIGLDVGVSFYPLRATASGASDGGIGISPFVFGSTDVKFPLTPQLTVELDATLGLDSGVAVLLRPSTIPKIKGGLLGAGGVVDGVAGRIYTALTYGPAPPDPTAPPATAPAKLTLMTLPGGGILEADSIALGGGIDVDHGVLSPELSAAVTGGHIVIRLGDADSFLGSIAPNGIEAHFAFAVRWSSAGGFHFEGTAAAAVDLPVSFLAGGFSLSLIHIELGPSASGLSVEVSGSGSAQLGPVACVAQRMGMELLVSFADGNLGPIDLGLAFRPPTGIGLSVDATAVSGGGFLSHAGDQYGGALELSICGVAVKAFGLIETQLPGGAKGYSALVILTAEFSPGLQIGFDFTLDGVGGLLGINRTVSTANIETAIWSHHFDGLLFPKNPVTAAPALMTAIDSYFPAAEGRYLFGPLAKIGWGDGMVEMLLGLVIELPEPIKLLLLGEIEVQVPVKLPQLNLHIDFAGGIDFGQKLAFFDASLHDSKIERYPLGGDLAFRYDWGDAPVFALAVGGFNPSYQAPANFPSLKRMSLAIGATDVQFTGQAYVAMTSNTLQFGARVELTAGTSSLNVHGFIGFDALVEWDPFAFSFALSAGIDLRAGGSTLASVHLDGQVSGTSPWHVSGDASVSFLFFDVSVHVDKQWGDTATALPPPDPTPLVIAALQDPSAWIPLASAFVNTVITAAPAPTDAGSALLLDPAGGVRISQSVAPLGQAITRFAGTSLGAPVTLDIDSANVSGATTSTDATAEFALAQFVDMTDDQKLSLPSFQQLNAGIDIGGDGIDLGQSGRTRSVSTSLAYETTIIDSATQQRPGTSYVLSWESQLAMHARLVDFVVPPPLVTLATEQYIIAGSADLKARPDVASDGTKHGALAALIAYVNANPAARGQLQIVLASEAA
jgi:hypothetical protein